MTTDPSQPSSGPGVLPDRSPRTHDRWARRPDGSTWGDWGVDDQLGSMNLLTPQMRRNAAREVQEGLAFCLSLPLDRPGGSALIPTRRPPQLFAVKREADEWNYGFPWRVCTGDPDHLDVTCDEAVTLFSQYSTQWDSLAHYGQYFDADGDGVPEKVFYNGFRMGEHLVPPLRAEDPPRANALSIDNLAATGVQGRGTLVDLHAVHGLERVAVGYDGLMRVLEAQGTNVARGDFLCLYTGFADLILAMDGQPDMRVLEKACSGLDGGDERLLRWISDSGIVAICADNIAVEVRSTNRPKGPRALMPLHAHCLFRRGIHLGELWYFRELAHWLRAHARHHFLLTAPPLRLPGAVGSPVTPVATV